MFLLAILLTNWSQGKTFIKSVKVRGMKTSIFAAKAFRSHNIEIAMTGDDGKPIANAQSTRTDLLS